MATVLEDFTIEEQRSGAEGLNTKDIHKEMFPVYGGKCLSRKAVHSGMVNVSMMTKEFRWRCGSY
jgi:hypothetical protein